jgi:iron complex outermembrane recepter protein
MSLGSLAQGKVNVMRCSVALASWLAPVVFGVTASSAQEPQQQGTVRDTIKKLAAVSIVATPSGRDQTRGANAIGKTDLKERAAGTSALKAVEKLPGVNMQSSDPWGSYEWANSITIRGFGTRQIGQTFDGLPLGDMSYGNFNGLGVGRAVDPENLAGASVAQGSGAIGTSSANNLGGVVQYASDAPRGAETFSLRQTVGAANTYRTTGRWDTGLRTFGSNGISSYLSFTRQDNDKWKGAGDPASPSFTGILGSHGLFHTGATWQEQVNAKSVAFIGANTLTGYYSFDNRQESDYVDFSLARWEKSGRMWDEFSNWADAKAYATSTDQQDEAYWKSSLGARRDHLAYVRDDIALGEHTTLSVQPYVHADKGRGDWTAPSYGATWSPDPLYFRETQYNNFRSGSNAKIATNVSGNALEAGLWYESNETHMKRPAWRLVNWQTGPEVDFNNVIRLNFDRQAHINTSMLYVQNTNTLLDDRLKVTYGTKYLNVDASFHSNGNTLNAPAYGDPNRPDFQVTARGSFLPQAGAVFSINEHEQLFTNYSENMNQYPLSPQEGIYNLDPSTFSYFKEHVKPERASSVDFGIRTKRSTVEASLSSYFIGYRNRLVSVANCQLTAFCPSVYENVGTITTKGVEGLLVWQLTPMLSWTTTASYNNSTINDNYSTQSSSGTTVIAAKGKQVVDAPRLMANSGLRFVDTHWTADFGVRHVDKRYFTILNNLSVPAYNVADAGIGYKLPQLGRAKELTVQLNVTNLFDTSYIGPMGTGGYSLNSDLQTLQAGARRLVFLTVGTTF